jgi:hypothetical protein
MPFGVSDLPILFWPCFSVPVWIFFVAGVFLFRVAIVRTPPKYLLLLLNQHQPSQFQLDPEKAGERHLHDFWRRRYGQAGVTSRAVELAVHLVHTRP